MIKEVMETEIEKVIKYLEERYDSAERWRIASLLYGGEQEAKKAAHSKQVIGNIKEDIFKILEVEE